MMPTPTAAANAAATPVSADALNALAETLWHLSLNIPEGPVRKNIAATRYVAQQMDAALQSALGAVLDPAEAAHKLMEALVNHSVTEAALYCPTVLAQQSPELRLAIGKVSLLYQQCRPEPTAEASEVDAMGARVPSPYAAASPNAAAPRGSATPATPATPAGPPLVFGYQPSPPPLPVDAAQPASLWPHQVALRPVPKPPDFKGLAAPASPTGPAPRVPKALRRCLSAFAALRAAPPKQDELAFVCPATKRVWQQPVIDLRDGHTYERSLLPMGVALRHVVDNQDVVRLVRAWELHHADSPSAYAAALEAASPHDASGALIADPILRACGETFSAQTLAEAFDRGAIFVDDQTDFEDNLFCVNHLLVTMMQHYNLGVPHASAFAAHAPASPDAQTPRSFGQVQQAYERISQGCKSPDYSDAFDAGLDLNFLLRDINRLLTQRCAPDERARLQALRLACRRLKGR